jgi:hypothetical protein
VLDEFNWPFSTYESNVKAERATCLSKEECEYGEYLMTYKNSIETFRMLLIDPNEFYILYYMNSGNDMDSSYVFSMLYLNWPCQIGTKLFSNGNKEREIVICLFIIYVA